MPKVYFVGSGYMGCNYVRLFLPMLANGWSGSRRGIAKGTIKDPKIVSREMLDSDVIVFHRANTGWHHRVAMILKEAGKKIVFDNDDTFVLDDKHPFKQLDEKGFAENKRKMNNVTNNFVRNADLVTTSTEFLAKEYRHLNKNVVVLPNYIDPSDWNEPLKNDTGKIRIGLVGSVAYNHDFEHIKKVIKKLDKDDRVQLVLFGLWKDQKRKENKLVEKVLKREYRFWDKLKNLEQIEWCEMEEYFETLRQAKLDMMLIPRRENYFNKCKSNIKFLEAAMLEIPVIAQGFSDNSSPYDKDLDGNNGILIKNNKDWAEEIELMIKMPTRRKIMGITAKEYVLDNYNINNHAQKWANVYTKLCEK